MSCNYQIWLVVDRAHWRERGVDNGMSEDWREERERESERG